MEKINQLWFLHRAGLGGPDNSQSAIRNGIDAFILAKLEEKGLALAPEADAAILIRRALRCE